MVDKEKSATRNSSSERSLGVQERRRADRFDAAFDVTISKTDSPARRIAVDAWVRDVSANGLGICCSELFEVGETVIVRAPGKSLQCEVRHCRAEGALYSMGLEVLSSSDGTDIQVSLRDLSKALHFSNRTAADLL